MRANEIKTGLPAAPAYRQVCRMELLQWKEALYIQWVNMSQAFVKEEDSQWLHDIQPTLTALIVYLTRENNGVRVYEQKTWFDPKENKEVSLMSNGLKYAKDQEGKWYIVW